MDSQLVCSEIIAKSGIEFGTSGARGLVKDFTPDLNAAFAIAFISAIENEFTFDTVAIAIDNRPSSYAIAQACAEALKQHGLNVVYYGVIPTPALAYKAMQNNMPCIMVTGSHIPFDRNGLKFYRPDGEITKADEQAILNNKSLFTALAEPLSELTVDTTASESYAQRYTSLFSTDTLKGKKIGIYEHSSAGRDIYKVLFEQLGAEVISLGRSDEFVPIDTEAVSEEDKQKALVWSSEYSFDAIFSTDGDGDRPLIADENGNWLRGDILGLLCSQLLNIEALATPVSCNTAIEKSASFKQVKRTKIGSPYVIAEFAELAQQYKSVAGFEANGGYLLGSDLTFNGKSLKALPTRDALLPALILLAQNEPVSKLLAKLPQRFTASDRIKDFAKEKSLNLINEFKNDASHFLGSLGYEEGYSVNTTDGLRIILERGDVVHLRPSGNAPELRCYTESNSAQSSTKLVVNVLNFISNY
ncbi:phosphomannomutase [Pseudoalteromonas sp. 13-15]|uniref:phosphomannomutase n=1 Tax=Pseudoalteromonas TaxID=53246 RepID=UPI000730FC9C|nr:MULTISPECIES: phosphomannomutase [Pseudoalteromonas]AUL74563.1 phosphomannomutase [Pseudoalteromonas sp. 13-15]WFO19462.1 phosphomannomutase [Pseudoalteromonas sp. H100]SIO05534.1 phosphomannomutase [Pseudoalteromonas marina]